MIFSIAGYFWISVLTKSYEELKYVMFQVYGIEFLEKYKSKYIPIQQWYLSHCKPKERSDIVIENTDYNCPIVVRA